MIKKVSILALLLSLLVSCFAGLPVQAASSPILITEVQTGFIDANSLESPRSEFIEIANISNAAVNMTGWKLEYLSAANDGSGTATQLIDTLSSQISAGGHGLWEHEGYYPAAPDSIFGFGDTSSSGFLAKSGGHVRLMNGSTMVDCVSWGSAVAITGCDKASAAAPAGYTLQRKLINGTYDKSAGVANLTPATPQGGNIYSTSVVAPPVNPPANPVQTVPEPTCDGVELSEILANPAGDDAQGEFIELYNPTGSDQNLFGCSLQLASGKQFAFSSLDSIEAHQYKAFPFMATNLQLSNSGTTVTLQTISHQSSTTYPAVSDDQAWALINGSWQLTNQPTPSAPNLANLAGTTAITSDSTVTNLEPCPAGKYRSPDTNRCRNIVTPATQVACPAGQERNILTNRCRKISATATTQTVCQADQVRNPDTNRCRKIAAASTQKPCPTGQERNNDTGRCRKVATKTGGKVLGISTSSVKSYHYALVGLILAAAGGYAIYEYRHDLSNLFHRHRKPTITS